MGKRKTQSPAMTARAKLLEKYRLKSNSNANVWLTKCPWTGTELALVGDPAYEHFYSVVGDPCVVHADFQVSESGRGAAHNFAARVENSDQSIELHSLYTRPGAPADSLTLKVTDLAQSMGAVHRWVTLNDLNHHRQRIANWRRMMRFVRAAEATPHEQIVAGLRLQFETRPELTVGQILETYPDVEEPVVIASIVQLLLRRAVFASLDRTMFTAATILKLKAAA